MKKKLLKHPAAFVFALCLALLGAAALPFVARSCGAQRVGAGEDAAAFERLRAMTRGGAKPAESAVASLAAGNEGTRTGVLARLLQARMRAGAGDDARAAELLRSDDFKERTNVGDHALWMRADALEKLNRRAEARAALEELVREYPESLRADAAALRAAGMLMSEGQAAGVPLALKELAAKGDSDALLLTAKAYEATNDRTRSLGAYRRLYFFAPAPKNDAEAAAALNRLGSTAAPANAEEAAARAEALYKAKRFSEAVDAYAAAFGRFPDTATPEARLRRGVAAFNARRAPETVQALNEVPAAPAEASAEAAHYLARHYARARQWQQARDTLDRMRRSFPQSLWTMRAMTLAGQAAEDAKNMTEALYFYRQAAQAFPGEPEAAGAQFDVAWAAHEANNFAESSRLLTEHLAFYADRNTDNRGRAGYWAARDSERAGKLAEAFALYEGMLARYDANWYGHLSRQRLEDLKKRGARAQNFAPDSVVARAVENLKPIAEAEETAGAAEAARLSKAEQLAAVGADDLAHAELDEALKAAPDSPALNLAKAKLHRARNENVQALNVLRRSFPDYSQMKPEELTRDEWDVFYPLAYWDAISRESRARGLDPYTVAGLIRQESVFDPRASSHANAYGLMQLLVPTAQLTARVNGVGGITKESLFEPNLNIRLGTTYFKQNLDKFGRVEYVAAAYNAGPGRAVAWRASLPLQMDEWAEAIPFRETRGYVQGVIRNSLQYRRLYDEQGRFRPEVGTRAERRDLGAAGSQAPGASAPVNTRPRRASGGGEE